MKLRKAIDLLVADGVLTRTQGKGTIVRRPRFDSSLFRFFRFKSVDGKPVRPTAKVLSREIVKPNETIRASLQMNRNEKTVHLSRVWLIEGRLVLSEEIWLPRSCFEALATLPLGDFEDLLYPLYDLLCRQIVASATEILNVEQATEDDAALLRIDVGRSSLCTVWQRILLGHLLNGAPLVGLPQRSSIRSIFADHATSSPPWCCHQHCGGEPILFQPAGGLFAPATSVFSRNIPRAGLGSLPAR